MKQYGDFVTLPGHNIDDGIIKEAQLLLGVQAKDIVGEGRFYYIVREVLLWDDEEQENVPVTYVGWKGVKE